MLRGAVYTTSQSIIILENLYMNIICFGVLTIALLTTTVSHAMEEKEDWVHARLNTILEQSPLTEEDYVNYVTENVFYNCPKSVPEPVKVLKYSNKALQQPNLSQEQLVHIYLNKAGAHDSLGKYSKVQKYYRKALEAKGEKRGRLEGEYQKRICPNFIRDCGVLKMEKDTLPGLSSHYINLGILISKMKEECRKIDLESSDPIYPDMFIKDR